MCGTEQALVMKNTKTSSVPETCMENGSSIQNHPPQSTINLDHGDPTMYESYWKKLGENCAVTIPGYQSLSYFANGKSLCWFMEGELEASIKMVHNVVRNAVVEDRHIVVGTGSSQLILAALYAVSRSLDEPNPINVVSATPYYSSYPEMIDLLQSGLFKWGGDARSFDEDGPYIEIVTSPNNPDGAIRQPLVNRDKGILVHDLAYYWPQYTAITSPADHDIMFFTMSKCTGHAGSRIGWAIVRDEEVAKKMVKFIEINTIGVSKEAQLRAVNILQIINLSCQSNKPKTLENFFEYSQNLLVERWTRLRDTIKNNKLFHISKFPLRYCKFSRDFIETYPAFAWMKCKDGIDCEKLLRGYKILARSGRRFGSDAEFVRISMLSRDEEFDAFLHRLSNIQGIDADGN